MRADTQLEYAIFQLTPTRTRCELHVVAKGSTYKLASGLLKPFTSHLQAAEEQLARGGYSIRLEPPDPSKAAWFTKGTMERFVRFVSTPEVLERVSSVEVELLELEETARQQTADDNESNEAGQNETAAPKAPSQLSPGGKPITFAASEKASKALSENAENGVEESTKQRLLRALDARRVMLQKEQGMAFARALAAGFNLENMDDLVLFAECFGANRLREACLKFLALCKQRQEAGLGLEDLELMAAENAQAEMAFLGAMSGSHVALSWPDAHGDGLDQLQSPSVAIEGKSPGGGDGTMKLTRRGSLDEPSREYWQSGPSLRPVNGSAMLGDGEGGPGIVNGHPMMAAWQGQPHNQYMPGAPPYGAMHPGMPNPSYSFAGPARPGQPGLQYAHYLGGPYMPPSYLDSTGWQSHSGVPPPYRPGNQPHDPADGGHPRPHHQQSMTTLSTREKDGVDSSKLASDDGYDDREDLPNELEADRTRRPARRSASPRRRSASPMRKVQIGRSAGSKRSGMVVIRNINYIAPKSQQHEKEDSENSESWSEDRESDEGLTNTAETLRASIEDVVGIVEGKNCATKDQKRKHSKKEKKKASPKTLMNNGDDGAEPENDGNEKNLSKPTEDVWILGNTEKGMNGSTMNWAREQGSYDPGLESSPVVKQSRENGKDCQLAEDAMVMSEMDGYVRPSPSLAVNMFEQEHQKAEESRKVTVMDDSYIIAESRSTAVAKGTTDMGPDFDFSSKVAETSQAEKSLSDDSFILLDRSATHDGASGEWRRPLNLESEMPFDQNLDVTVPPERFQPNDLFMIPERSQDTYKRAWNTPLDYDMHAVAADMMDKGHESHHEQEEENAVAIVEPEVLEEDIEYQPMESSSKKLSEKDAKAKAMKEMLERRKSQVGARPGRPNPLAEAQLRAEKLRQYKAGLQKSKKEKEEEERKRIEDLKNKRQQRIAARSNPNGSPSSPSLARVARTAPLTVSKSSPKAPDRLSHGSSPKTPNRLSNGSSLSPSLSRDRVSNGSRLARTSLESLKSGESTVSRSVSSLTDAHRETKKATSAVRASTASQLSHTLRSDGAAEASSHLKVNGGSEDKLGRSKSSRADDKLSRTDSGLAEERIQRTESARLEEKLGRTESGREGRVSQRESGSMAEKGQTSFLKTVKKVAPQDVPLVAAKSVKSSSTDSKPVKRVLTVPSKSPAPKKNAMASPAVTVQETLMERKALPLPQKEEPKVESPVKSAEHENLRPVLATNAVSDEVKNDSQNLLSNENVNVHVEDKFVPAMGPENSVFYAEKTGQENGSFIPKATVSMLEEFEEDPLCNGSPPRAGSVAGMDDRELEVEADSSVGEDYHAPVAHVSPSKDKPTSITEADLHASDGQVTEHYSPPPFTPRPEYSSSPLVNPPQRSPSMQQTEMTMEANMTDTSATRSRKKWGDSKAKGLKRLLLLGRKSSRSSGHNSSDVPSEYDEEESPSSNGNSPSIKFATSDLDSFNEQAGAVSLLSDASPPISSSKGSRSIFSLSTFRGKSTAKA